MVLVTGASGFVGSRLVVDLLESGNSVRALRRSSSIIPELLIPYSSRIEWVEGDVLDIVSLENAMDGIDYVYHCAALISFSPAMDKQMMKINIEGTANVVNTALHKGLKKMVHVSSIAALGPAKKDEMITEEHYWDTSTNKAAYSISKHGGEQEVWRGIEEGLNAVIVNPSIIIGPGEFRGGSSRLFELAYKGMKFYTNGSNGFVDVRDVSKCMIGLMESNISAQRFILSAGSMSYKDFFDQAAAAFGKPGPTIEASWLMIEIGWRLAALKALLTGKNSEVSKSSARMSAKKHQYSNKKIRQAIDFSFISIESTIVETCLVYKKYKQIIN